MAKMNINGPDTGVKDKGKKAPAKKSNVPTNQKQGEFSIAGQSQPAGKKKPQYL
jgi:hypothetical protein